MKRHPESHLDHALTDAQIAYLCDRFADRDSFFVETVELPADLGSVPCALYGPLMGDPPVEEHRVRYANRGSRQWPSRLVDLPTRATNLVTVIAGPHDGQPCILYTAVRRSIGAARTWRPRLQGSGRVAPDLERARAVR